MLVPRCPVHRELRCHVNVLTFSSRRVLAPRGFAKMRLAFMFRGPTMSVGSILKAPSAMGSENYRTVCSFLKKRYATSSVSLIVLLRANFSLHVVSKLRLGAVQEFNRFLRTACACCALRRYLYTIASSPRAHERCAPTCKRCGLKWGLGRSRRASNQALGGCGKASATHYAWAWT